MRSLGRRKFFSVAGVLGLVGLGRAATPEKDGPAGSFSPAVMVTEPTADERLVRWFTDFSGLYDGPNYYVGEVVRDEYEKLVPGGLSDRELRAKITTGEHPGVDLIEACTLWRHPYSEAGAMAEVAATIREQVRTAVHVGTLSCPVAVTKFNGYMLTVELYRTVARPDVRPASFQYPNLDVRPAAQA